MQNRAIVGIGETVLDIVFRNNQPQAAVPGGSVFNAMVSLGRTAARLPHAGFLFGLLRHGFTRERLQAITEADWEQLVPTAMRFSADVCASLQNYVRPDFQP